MYNCSKDQRRQLAELLSLRCALGFAAAAGTAALGQRLGPRALPERDRDKQDVC